VVVGILHLGHIW